MWRLTGRRKELLEETAGEVKALGRRALAHGADVADPEAVKALFAEVEREFGRLDLLFNNAGRGAPQFRSTNCPMRPGRRWSTSTSTACSFAPRPPSA